MISGLAWTVSQDSAWGRVRRKAGSVIKLQGFNRDKYLYETHSVKKNIL